MTKENVVDFKEAKRPRNELELPSLHFVVVDNWIKVIGERALMAWLRMYSWCDRSNHLKNDEDMKSVWEQSSIPTSLNSLIKKLGVGRDTFYNKILKPLWNVGLIDIEEFKESKSNGVKPLNIIIYKYPQNNFSLAIEPLKEVRDYDEDYSSTSKTFAKKGGIPKKKDGSNSEPGVVLKENQGWFSNRTGGGSEMVHNNISNSITNNLNSINNNLNSINNTTTTTESDVAEIISFWDSNGFGINNIHAKQSLLLYLNDNSFDEPKEMIIEAMKIACGNGKTFGRFIEGILKRWINQNIRCVKDISRHSFTEYQTEYKNHKSYPAKEEVVPEWFKERKREKSSEVTATEDQKIDLQRLKEETMALIEKHAKNG